MTHAVSIHRAVSALVRFAEHTLVVAIGFVMIIVGLAMGVTMVLLPAGVVIGLLGVAFVVAGLFGRLNQDH